MALTVGTPTVLLAKDHLGQLHNVRVQRSDVDLDSLYEGNAAIIIATTQEGDASHNEIETVTVAHAIGGTFTVTDPNNPPATTAAIAYNASAAAFKTAYEALANVGSNNTTITKSIATDGLSWTYTIEYVNTLELTNRTQVTASATGLTSNATTGEPLAASDLNNAADDALVSIVTTKTPASNAYHKAYYRTDLQKLKVYSSTAEAAGNVDLTGLAVQVVTIGNKA